MNFELSLIRSARPPRDATLIPKLQPTAPARKAIREVTDAVVETAHDLQGLTKAAAATMLVVAEVLDDFEIDPDVPELIEATKLLIATARTVLDRGLLITNWPQAKAGAVMLELTVRGICAALSIPYDDVLREVHRASVAGEEANVQAILAQAGLIEVEKA